MAQDDRVCNSCGGALNEDSKFCPACGTNVEIPSDVDCPSCGEKNAPDSNYCDKCGSLLQEQTQEPSESSSQQPFSGLRLAPRAWRRTETTELEPSAQACRVCGNTLNPAEPNSLDEELCVPCYEESINLNTEKVAEFERSDNLREEQRLVDDLQFLTSQWKDESRSLWERYINPALQRYFARLTQGVEWLWKIQGKVFNSVKSTEPVPQNTASIKDSDKVDTLTETTELEPSAQACRVCGNTLNPAEPNSLDEELCVPCYEELVYGNRFEPMYNYSLMKDLDRMKGNWRGIFNSQFFKLLKSFVMMIACMFTLFWVFDHVPFLSNLGSEAKLWIVVVLSTLVSGLATKETRGFVINLVKFGGALGLLILCVAGLALSILVIILVVEGIENTPFFKIFIR